ncbi:MAG: lysophospholipid acyltransferase family protein [Pseudomonadota bacterium]
MSRHTPAQAWRQHWIWHPLQALPMYLTFKAIGLLPVDWTSAMGDRLGRWIGPKIRKPTEKSLSNLALAFPEKSEEERRQIMRDMWGHLGRVVTEYASLGKIANSKRITIYGDDNIRDIYGKHPLLLISGHVGHWEISPVIAKTYGMEMTGIYRPPNNRFVDRIIRGLRVDCGMTLLPRGTESIRNAMGVLAKGGNLAMLVDQRSLRGRKVPFFGHDAETAPTTAEMALRYGAKLVPVRVKRTGGAHFDVICEPPIEFESTGDREADVNRILLSINQVLENWLRDTPEQWLWPHRRWG